MARRRYHLAVLELRRLAAACCHRCAACHYTSLASHAATTSPPSRATNSRPFNWSNGIGRPTSQDRAQDSEKAAVSQEVVGQCDNLSAAGELCPLWPFLCLHRERSCDAPAARAHRPQSRAAEERDELSPPYHSITSSARASSIGGTSMRSNFAVCRLMSSSSLLTCNTGSSAGFSPLRMRPEYTPTWRYMSVMLVP